MKRRKKLQKFQSFVSYLHYLEIIAYLSNKSTKSPLRPLGAHLATFSENVVANKKIHSPWRLKRSQLGALHSRSRNQHYSATHITREPFSINHKNYNFLEFDWSISSSIFVPTNTNLPCLWHSRAEVAPVTTGAEAQQAPKALVVSIIKPTQTGLLSTYYCRASFRTLG